jgi:hypothetical protein
LSQIIKSVSETPCETSVTTEHDIERMLIEAKRDLLKQGLNNGKNAVYVTFIAFGIVYASNFILYCVTDKIFITQPYLLGFSGVLAVALLIYFSFIFGYSLYLTTDLSKKRLELETKKNPCA